SPGTPRDMSLCPAAPPCGTASGDYAPGPTHAGRARYSAIEAGRGAHNRASSAETGAQRRTKGAPRELLPLGLQWTRGVLIPTGVREGSCGETNRAGGVRADLCAGDLAAADHLGPPPPDAGRRTRADRSR